MRDRSLGANFELFSGGSVKMHPVRSFRALKACANAVFMEDYVDSITMFSRLHILFRVLPVLFFLLWMNRAIADSPLPVQTVFIILMENHDWSTIVGTTNCPYINSLLP